MHLFKTLCLSEKPKYLSQPYLHMRSCHQVRINTEGFIELAFQIKMWFQSFSKLPTDLDILLPGGLAPLCWQHRLQAILKFFMWSSLTKSSHWFSYNSVKLGSRVYAIKFVWAHGNWGSENTVTFPNDSVTVSSAARTYLPVKSFSIMLLPLWHTAWLTKARNTQVKVAFILGTGLCRWSH